jgi:hypothetical protein
MEMTREEQFYARKLFQLEVHKRNGQAFEDFFTRIMQLSNSNFLPVAPQGSIGDRKNDGFVKDDGKYYQVYAPQDPAIRESQAIKKLDRDFKGLYSFWNKKVTPIREFYFVLNDKYKGAYPTLYPEFTKIEKKHPAVKCNPFLAQHLEDVFMSLPVTLIEDILGPIILPENIELFDSSIMNEVVKYLLATESPRGPEVFPENPAFEDKILFNGLSSQVAQYLRFGSFQEGELKNYFKVNSTFAKSDIRDTFNGLYRQAVAEIPNNPEKSDLVFFFILDKAHPQKNFMIRNTLYALMAYFFSYCDIFEEPIKTPTLFK